MHCLQHFDSFKAVKRMECDRCESRIYFHIFSKFRAFSLPFRSPCVLTKAALKYTLIIALESLPMERGREAPIALYEVQYVFVLIRYSRVVRGEVGLHATPCCTNLAELSPVRRYQGGESYAPQP